MKHVIELPRWVKIGGHVYKIQADGKAQQRLRSVNRYGECTEAARELKMSTDFGARQFSETTIHEILHAVDSVYNNSEITERQNSALAEGLWQVFEQLGIEFVPKK